MLRVHEFLTTSAERFPQKTALVCGSARHSYADLEAMANRLAHALLECGLERGDRVAIFMPNSVESVVAIFAVLKAGGVFVVVNHATRANKLAYILRDCAARAIVVDGRRAGQVLRAMEQVPSLRCGIVKGAISLADDRLFDWAAVQERYPAQRPAVAVAAQDLACLVYTSGSTGEPKGVMEGHDNVDFVTSSIISYLDNQPEDVVIDVLPFSFDYGLYQLLMTFKFGGTLVLEKSFAYPVTVLQKIAAERVTGLPGVPTLFALLMRMDLSCYDFSCLRYITNTAAALPVRHIQEIRRSFPAARLYSMYGLTECKRTLYLPPEELERRPTSVGIPIPGTEVWIEGEDGSRVGPGEVGELVVRGPHVMRGYWNSPELTARSFRPGPAPGERLLYTGDLFWADEEGFYYFVSRQDDIIKSRGEKVAPKEIENVLCGLPGVAEAAVVGVPDPLLGEAIKAFVVASDPALTEQDVLRHCRLHLEDLMVPQHVEFLDALPKMASGKVFKTDLV
ncbi:MAG: AMP-binding protein [Anaerolineae bacterium]|nr:AMP-binding protein [Anaerolineae bacterium]